MAIDAAGLSALEERAAFTDRSACGRLWITGVDVLDLLNRLTTNQLETLPEGLARSTVLTNGDARVIDHLLLAAVDGGLWCLTSPGRAEAVVEWIDLYTFGEDISVEDASATTAQLTVAGPLATDALASAHYPVPLPDGAAASGDTVVIAAPFGARPVYHVLLPLAQSGRATEALDVAAQEVSAETFEAYRIAQGVPAYESEFGAFNNPLEARLLGSISEDKGCYTGQEVIARLQTYRKVQRLLMSFTSDVPAAPGDALESGDGSPAGVVTSACADGEGALGLALVPSKHAVAGASLRLAGGGAAILSDPLYALATEPVEA